MSGLIGASAPRRDAPAKVTGAARQTDDLAVPGAWFGLTVRSAEPHAPAKGSMAPRIESCIWFLQRGDREAIVTDPESLLNAVRGRAGAHIVKDE